MRDLHPGLQAFLEYRAGFPLMGERGGWEIETCDIFDLCMNLWLERENNLALNESKKEAAE